MKQKKEITIVFLDATKMRRINYQYRHKNKATDVLSFTSNDPVSLGELLLCPSVLKSQAKQAGHSLRSEINLMFIHGVLHLLGYDHELSKLEEKLMFRLQEQVFKSFNKDEYVDSSRITRN